MRYVKVTETGHAIISEMAYSDDHFRPVGTQCCRTLVGFLKSVEIFYSFAAPLENYAFRVKVKSDESDFVSVDLFHDRRHEQSFESRTTEVIIGAEACRIDLTPFLSEFVHAAVKLMIAEYADIIAHLVHQHTFHLATKQCEIQRTLHGIACVDKHHVTAGGAYAVDNDFATCDTAVILHIRVDGRVGIIGVKYHQMVGIVIF